MNFCEEWEAVIHLRRPEDREAPEADPANVAPEVTAHKRGAVSGGVVWSTQGRNTRDLNFDAHRAPSKVSLESEPK